MLFIDISDDSWDQTQDVLNIRLALYPPTTVPNVSVSSNVLMMSLVMKYDIKCQ
jgi:hypothetical protein